MYKHALKNALIPVVTLAGMQFSQVFAGAVLVETVFNWPGMGRLAYESILRKDYPTLLGILFCSVFVVIIANVLTDLRPTVCDPKMRVGGGSHVRTKRRLGIQGKSPPAVKRGDVPAKPRPPCLGWQFCSRPSCCSPREAR